MIDAYERARIRDDNRLYWAQSLDAQLGPYGFLNMELEKLRQIRIVSRLSWGERIAFMMYKTDHRRALN